MKNNLAFKFIAVILCAASLLGAIGGITGVAVLASGDLYNKTVEQVQQENTAVFVESKAKALALQYSSSTLGGCPESMVTNLHGIGNYFAFTNYGYRILDAQGNVLSAYNEDLQETATLFTQQPKGQYMHLVELESESERLAREQEEWEAQQPQVEAGYNSNEIPDVGIEITQVILYDEAMLPIYSAGYFNNELHVSYYEEDSSSGYTGYSHFNAAGYLIVNQKGQLVYSSYADENFESLPDAPIHAADFSNDRETFYYTVDYSQSPIGRISSNSTGRTVFETFVSEPMVVSTDGTPMLVETVDPEASVETFALIPVAESVPATEPMVESSAPAEETLDVTAPTAAEESVPAETVAEAIPAAETTEATEETMETAVTEKTVETAETTEETETTEATEETETTEATETTETTEPTEPPTEPTVPETIPEETLPAETEPVMINGKALDSYQVNTETYWDHAAGEAMTAKYVYVPMPELTVELYVDEASYRDADLFAVLKLVRNLRGYLLPLIGISLLLFAVFAVYLCTAAGRKPGSEEVRAGGLNRIPLDLYFLGGGFAIALMAAMGVEGSYLLLQRDFNLACTLAVAAAFGACLVFVGFCYAMVAQFKTPGGYWYRNTLCGHTLRLTCRFMLWLERFLREKCLPLVGRTLKGTWKFTWKACVWCFRATERTLGWTFGKLGAAFRWIGRKLNRFFSLMPMTWQWTVAGMFWFCLTLIAGSTHSSFLTLVGIVGAIAMVLYAAHCFGVLLESTKKMSKGDLSTKVDDKLMVGCFQEFAEDLNDLADVAVVAAQKQLKSERMKTELITNVSHDIKTPLTSIINYVDLLQKPHSPEEAAQYLEVLERQSQRLKKLIDDLMDMSKANTGNMQVDITTVDAVESVNQALGEFSDKLDRAMLIPVFRHEEDRIPMQADGRLVWRVLSNLLSNAVKYAMPGTRLYIDLMTLEGKVVLSLKNISREELNIDADELMERFVRGDDSRNTEGSGLGLNIAKSLMELQKGQLQLLVDGDLFKVTLIFPGE